MRKTLKHFGQAVLLIGIWIAAGLPAAAKDVPRMTKEELKALLGNPDVVVIDVRTDNDWQESREKIKGAVRETPENVGEWMNKYSKDKTLVFYCA